MSKRNAQVFALAGVAALAGFGYTLARRSSSRSARSTRTSSSSLRSAKAPTKLEDRPEEPLAETIASEPAPWQDGARISSSPDALDLALDLDGVFDGKSSSDLEVTARPTEHVPAPLAGDDEDALSPDDLGRAWLTQATESDRSLGVADTLPDVENLRRTNIERGEVLDTDGDGEDDDETTAEYVRRHRISSAG